MNCKKLAAIFVLVFTRPAWSVEPAPMEITDDVMAVAKGGNEFATDLYARLRSDKPTNLFFSPYSISVALAMTYAGAEGQTEAQIAKVLHFPAPEAKLHSAFSTLRKLLASSDKTPGFQLRVANRLWGQKGFISCRSSCKSRSRLRSRSGPAGFQASRSRPEDDQLVDRGANRSQDSGFARSRCPRRQHSACADQCHLLQGTLDARI